MGALVGHEVSMETTWNPSREETRWIGKPWRRLEFTTWRHFYQGEEVEREREFQIHVGLRRLGFAFTVTFLRSRTLDYSDGPNQ